MPIFTPASPKTHLDDQGDDASQARPQLETAIDNLNTLNAGLGNIADKNVGAGLEISGTTIKVAIGPTDDVDIDHGVLT